MFAGTAPQWLTVFIALSAAILAWHSIETQKATARKRAAIDFFIKTETDSYMLTAWKAYEEARVAVRDCDDLDAFSKGEHWRPLRDYLNLHELLAVGVKKEVLDPSVCYDFWRNELTRAYRDCIHAIKFIQRQKDQEKTYCEVVDLYEQWSTQPPDTTPISPPLIAAQWLKACFRSLSLRS
jgi:hypothetical protein